MRRAARAAAAALLFLAVSELLVRLSRVDLALLAPLLYYQGADLPLHRPSEDPRLLYELRPGASGVISGREIGVNAFGFRDPPRSARKPAGVFRIVCFGDSNTYGALVDDDRTYPALLEKRLNRARPGGRRYEVWNAGVSAYSVAQSAAWAESVLRLYEPDLLVFQVDYTKRRAFLLGAPFERYFDADPGLYLENLRFLPFGGDSRDAALLRVSRLARALTAAYNRLADGPGNNPSYSSDRPSEDALRRLAREREGRPPVVLLFNPGWRGGFVDELGLPQVRLEDSLPRGASAEFRLIHPPARVYRWYAEVLAKSLPLPR